MTQKQAGFMLLELVMGMALMVLIMSGVAGMLTNLIGHSVRASDLIDRQQEARWAVDMIARDLRYATACTTRVGTGTAVEMVKTDSRGSSVKIGYKLVGTSGGYVLTRTYTYGTTAEASLLGNVKRGYVGAGYFTVTVTASGTAVSQVHIVYKIGRDAADTNPAVAETTIYPLNGLTANLN
ncbi:MAG: hypothetical protein H6Q73_1492 [Firmicutes bacterium]|nr:hypothetical protein [Bacillota bacterium]